MSSFEFYIFGHRGAMGYCIENTMESFKKAVETGAGIETDLRFTKDNNVICFHDSIINLNSESMKISNLTLKQVKTLKFKDERIIPTLKEVFEEFQEYSNDIYYSFDISNRKVGMRAIELAEKYSILDKIFITDQRLSVLSSLRKIKPHVHLIHTIPHIIYKINQKNVNLKKLKKINVSTLNIKSNRFTRENCTFILKNDFNAFVWSVNIKIKMKQYLKFEYKGKKISAFYTDFPDIFLHLIQGSNEKRIVD